MNQNRANQLLGIICVNLATLVWASNMVIGRMVRDCIGPLTISATRFILAAAIFYLLLRRQPPEERRIDADFRLLAVMAFTGIVLFSPILYWGLHYTTAVNGTIINGLAPLLTGLFAAVLIRVPMTGRQLGGAIAALFGVLILISGGSLSFWQTAQFNKGDLLVLGAVAIWGLYSVIASRVMKKRSAVSATAFSTFLGLPVLCLFAVWELQYIPVTWDYQLLLTIAYLGIVPAAGGFYAWNAGVARLGPGDAMVFYNTLPLYGALLGFLFLGEPIEFAHVLGGLLIIGGGIWTARKPAPVQAKAEQIKPQER